MRDIFQGIFTRSANARRRQREAAAREAAAREAAARNPPAAGHSARDTLTGPNGVETSARQPASPGTSLPRPMPQRPEAARVLNPMPAPLLDLAGMHAAGQGVGSREVEDVIASWDAFISAFQQGMISGLQQGAAASLGGHGNNFTIELRVVDLSGSNSSVIFTAGEDAPMTDADIEQAAHENEIENQRHFEHMFDHAHAGSVKALRSVIDTLRARNTSQVPEGGITQEHIDERHWDITYKLPALLLAQHLPAVCQGHGSISNIALFDHVWQKTQDNNEPYPSMLPEIYQHLLTMHGHDADAVKQALPTLVPRICHLLETGDAQATSLEKRLTSLIQDAVHHIDGKILYEALGKAWAHLPNA